MNTETRDERRSALDEFAMAAPSTATVPVHSERGHVDHIYGAQPVAVYRDERRILSRLKELAAAMGEEWYYRFPVRNKKENRVDFIEGPSIKLTNDLARIYGNCEVDVRVQDVGDTWLFYARFLDLETGYSLTRPFQQRKSAGKIGGDDDARRLDIAFQIGASKALRNVVTNALQTFSDFAFTEAKSALIDRIGKDLPKYRERTADKIRAHVEINRVEAVVGRPWGEWLAPDVSRVIAMMKAVQDGMSALDETFPPLKAADNNTAGELDGFAAAGQSSLDSATGDGGAGSPDTSLAGEPDATNDEPPAIDRGEVIDKILRLAADKAIAQETRLALLTDALNDWIEQAPGGDEAFIRQCHEQAVHVANGTGKAIDARRYLLNLKDKQ